MDVRVFALLSGNSSGKHAPIGGGSTRPSITLLGVDTHDSDIGKKCYTAPGTNRPWARGGYEVHTPPIPGVSLEMGIPQKTLDADPVTRFAKDLPPGLNRRGMPAMNAPCACASRPMMAKRI